MSVIADLNQSINCGGKCDCCSNLQQQINELNQKLNAYIPRAERGQIINESYQMSILYFDPKILGLKGEIDLVKTAIQGIGILISLLQVLVEQIKNGINALTRFVQEKFPELQRYVNEEIRKLYDQIKKQKQEDYNQQIAELRQLISQLQTKDMQHDQGIEGLRVQYEQLRQNLAFQLATITSQLRGEIQQVRTQLESFVRGEIAGVKSNLQQIRAQLESQIQSVSKDAKSAISKADIAAKDAKSAISKADIAAKDAKSAISKADIATKDAKSAISKADIAAKDAKSAISKADIAAKDAKSAISKADIAAKDAKSAISKADIAAKDAKSAISKADIAAKDAKSASSKADAAAKEVKVVVIQVGSLDSKISGIIPTIPSIAEEYAKKYAYRPTIELGQMQQKIDYSQQYAINRLQKEQDNRWREILRREDLFTGGVFDRVDAIGEASRRELLAFAKKADLEAFVSQYGASFSPAKTAELERIRAADRAEVTNLAGTLGQFKNSVNQIVADRQSDRRTYQEELKKVAVKEVEKILQPSKDADKEKEKQIAALERRLKDNEQAFTQSQKQTQAEVDALKQRLAKTFDPEPLLEKQRKTESEIEKVKRILQEDEAVNKEIVAKLDGIIPTIAGIPIIVGRIPDITAGKIPGVVAPLIPTVPQIGNEVDKRLCNNQCVPGAINSAADNITRDIGNKIDKANSAGQTAMLTEILSRMGDKIPGGLSGKLVNGFKWLQLDRALNMLTFAATVHNAAQLSSDIAATLGSALSNVVSLIGIKDDSGKSLDIGALINSSIQNAVKAIIGAENYDVLSNNWAKANRIYQATANVLNTTLSLSQTVLQASELIAGYTGRIGNALKKGGVVLENAYTWMNPNPNFSNRVSRFLEGFQQTASTIQMVTQAPLDIVNATTELTTASTELVKSIKEDDKEENKGIKIEDPSKLKEDETKGKTDSKPATFDFSDLFDGED